jgi:hypothetical protein
MKLLRGEDWPTWNRGGLWRRIGGTCEGAELYKSLASVRLGTGYLDKNDDSLSVSALV